MSRMKELATIGELVMMGKAHDFEGNHSEASVVIDYILQTLLGDKKDVSGDKVIELANKYHEGGPMKVRHMTTSMVEGMRMIVLCLDDPMLDEEDGMTYDQRLNSHYVFSYVYNVDCPDFSELGDVYMEKKRDGCWHRTA